MDFSRRDTAKSATSVQSAKIKRTSTPASQGSASAPARQPQVVDDRYLDEEKLKAYLEEHFPDQWKIQVKLGKWIITAPETIPEDILDALSG